MSGDEWLPMAMVEVLVGGDRVADEADPLRVAFDALVAGDLDALGAIYDAQAHELFGVALWRTGSREDAADIVQEVFVRLARARTRLAKVRNPPAYLHTIAHRAAVDLLRQRRRTEPVDDALLEPVVPDHAATIDAARLSALVHALPAVQREAICLRHFAGLSFAEIGAATRVPTFTAASRCRLGLARLRKLLGGAVMSDSFEPFGDMRPPLPPRELRDRALGAARAAAFVPARERTGSGRWGFSRFDLVWVAALLLLLVCHALISTREDPSVVAGSPGGAPVALARVEEADRQLARELGVSPSLVASGRLTPRPGSNDELRKLLADPVFERL